MSLLNLNEQTDKKSGRAHSEIIENDIKEIEQIHKQNNKKAVLTEKNEVNS